MVYLLNYTLMLANTCEYLAGGPHINISNHRWCCCVVTAVNVVVVVITYVRHMNSYDTWDDDNIYLKQKSKIIKIIWNIQCFIIKDKKESETNH